MPVKGLPQIFTDIHIVYIYIYSICLYALKLADQPAPYFDNCKGLFLSRPIVGTPIKND